MSKTFDVFLSHSNKDREFVVRLANDLAGAGVDVWLDQWSLNPGETLAEAIDQALKASRFLVVVMSPDYFQSQWAQQEWHYALASELGDDSVKLIPLMYRDCEVPSMLRTKVWIDFRDPTNYRGALDRLVRGIRDLSRRTELSGSEAKSPEPKPGERIEELDPTTLSDLKAVLKDAVEAFKARPETQTATAAAIEA